MKRIGLILVCLSVLIFCSANAVSAVSQKEILEHLKLYPEMKEYKMIFLDNLRDQNLDWPEKFQKIINQYKLFIVK